MAVRPVVSEDGSRVTIHVTGRFDFGAHREFRGAYESSEGQSTRFEVDLGGAEYLDSAALGMLLVLREHAGGDRSRVSITHCSDEVRSVLEIANFARLFDIQ